MISISEFDFKIYSIKFDPMNPSPPVTSTRII